MSNKSVSHFLIENDNKTGIDLDDVSEFEFLKAYFNTRYMFPDKKIKIYKSSGGKGYHIEVIGIQSRLSVRRTLCDCRDRMSYSIMRSSSVYSHDEIALNDPIVDDVMFSCKTKAIDSGNLRRVYRQQRTEIDHDTIISQGFWYSPNMGILYR